MSASIYVQCGEAARRLLDDPGQRIATSGPEGIFTELDVIFLGAREAQRLGEPWSEDDMRLAAREASQVMGSLFRTGQAVRFGPVLIPGFDSPDYMRVASKIVYAHPEGPEALATPNGRFPRMTVFDDNPRQGRRSGANRDDLEPWDEQAMHGDGPTTSAEHREILRLKAENAALTARLEEVETEIHRLREHKAQNGLTEQDLDRILIDRGIIKKRVA